MSQAQNCKTWIFSISLLFVFFYVSKKELKIAWLSKLNPVKKKKAGLIQILWYFQGSNYIIASLFLLIFRKDVDIWFICMCFQ